jgi:AcrR family transcriptional regulator
MNAVLQPMLQARQPLQQRSRDRFEQVLKAADALLAERGLAGFSIPELAARLGYTRASIYKFFPTPYAVLNELAQRYLKLLEDDLVGFAAELSRQSWIEVGTTVVNRATAFYEAHPVARLLILGGPLTDDGYRAQELTIQRLGTLLRQLSQQRGILLPREPVDVATQAVEIGTGCFRQSYFRHGRITDAYRKEAAYAMLAYLSRYVGDETARPRS